MRLLLEQINRVYTRIDNQVKTFQLKTGLRCPNGCGTCCPTADVQVSILEMLPAAYEILRQGTSADWLERIDADPAGAVCVFYGHQPAPDAQGHCGFYVYRPAVCRLFGFATVRNRAGTRELSVCMQAKNADPAVVAAARAHQAGAPCFSDVCTEISLLDMPLGARLMPINQALRRALLKLGLSMHLAQNEKLGAISAA
jgi:Fe-S-cluster containining protein